MLFSTFARYLQTIEKIDSRLKMTEVLASLFSEVEALEIDKVCYLSLGRLAPKFIGLELQLAGKMMIRAISQVTKVSPEEVTAVF